MPFHHDYHCKHCSTNLSKRAKGQLPQSQPHLTGQTVRVLDIRTRDIFPCLKIAARIFTKTKEDTMPSWIRLEKCETTKEYAPGWNYVEARHGRLVMVRNKKDNSDIHQGGWKKLKPREGAKKYILVERDDEQIRRGRPAQPRDGKVFIEVRSPGAVRRGSPDSDETMPQPRIQARRPVLAPPPSPYWQRHEPRQVPQPHYYLDEAHARLVKKVPVEKAHLQRVRPVEVVREDTYSDDTYYDYEEMFSEIEMPIREPRPYHVHEPENSYWDDDLDAWIMQRKPRVRFE